MGPSDDNIVGDNVTQYEIIVLDEGEIGSRADLAVPNELIESGGCSKDSSYVKVPLPSSSSYVAGIRSRGAPYYEQKVGSWLSIPSLDCLYLYGLVCKCMYV